jgi:hypothetical protein
MVYLLIDMCSMFPSLSLEVSLGTVLSHTLERGRVILRLGERQLFWAAIIHYTRHRRL